MDFDYNHLKQCLSFFNGNPERMAEAYYAAFCMAIKTMKPDIIGHFDLITKFDERNTPLFLSNERYQRIARKYLQEALKNEIIFEVNTGAMARGLRTTPYPDEQLLYEIKRQDGKVMLSSDSHRMETLDFGFAEAQKMLKEIGFSYLYTIRQNEFQKIYI